ncbi:transporter substrate-binding domain-containing protein [Loigolactobacillus bifermentans]|jgi:putative glutamine transport system substrate-binding protein|uniref:ABC transporter periplasmic subunit n=1 Tax=Loigolactobacillus bifermentans DSM 20003 TaxID=1423726 RepID=A0A0R1GG44_9LACO|nr:transporter substrate-binding domain-containing protein [Loigolactobacillus bifermentans]KRK33190.1 ABC transporter periplasmic subunit [Loigolactobacillus bifermentans DSM 20003]QGG60539.1 transporter substrate-binding domain-containing protein [Loigolactobacillus bifermentans]
MRKFVRRLLPIAFLLSLVLLMSGCGRQSLAKQDVLKDDRQSNTITWGVKADTRLFGLMNVKTGVIQGFDVDMAKHITKHILGKDGKAKFVQITSNTRIPLLRNGNIDAIIATMTISPERAKQVDFSKPYFNAGQAILVNKNSKIKSIYDLNYKGAKVLAVQGSTSALNVRKAAPKASVLELSDYAQAFTALQSGQGQALTTDNGILYGMSLENPQYRVVGGTFTKEPYGIAVNKGQDNMTNAVNKAVKDMKKSGEYQKLLNKWFGKVPGFNEGSN